MKGKQFLVFIDEKHTTMRNKKINDSLSFFLSSNVSFSKWNWRRNTFKWKLNVKYDDDENDDDGEQVYGMPF